MRVDPWAPAVEACQDDLALDSLRQAAGVLEVLDGDSSTGDLTQAVERAIAGLCRAIEACEDARIDRREILAQLGTARAIHARSPFIARAQEWPRGYPGDYETIEYLCDATNRAPGWFAGSRVGGGGAQEPNYLTAPK